MGMSSIEKAVEKLREKTVSADTGKPPEILLEQSSQEKAVSKRHESEYVQQHEKSTVTKNTTADAVIQDKTNFPILQTLESHGMVSPSLKDSRQAEEYRQIKRPLLVNATGKNRRPVDKGNVVMVTSAFPGEGKTYTTINLAMSVAIERNHSVLIVDCDVIKQSLSSLFGLENQPGLLDVLEGEEFTLKDVIVSTDVPSLKILPAGQAHDYSTELLASDEMGRIMDEMAARYSDRIIIFDSPPLLMTSQSAVLTSHAGQILVVVEEGVTPQNSVVDAISQLDKNKVIGTILNKRSRLNRGDQYGGYYGSYGE